MHTLTTKISMTTSAFIDRIRYVHIIIISLAFLSVNVLINLFSADSYALSVFNASFEMSMSILMTILFFSLYFISRKRNYVFSRTLKWMGFALTAWALGDSLYLYQIGLNIDPFISISDVFYVTATLLVIISVLTIPGLQPASRRRNMVFIEISILVLSATVLFTVLLLMPGNPDLNFPAFTMLMVFIYPVLDIILLWVIMIMFFTYTIRTSQKVLGALFVGALFIFFSDCFYLINNLYATLIDSYIVDTGYFGFYVMILLAGFIGFREIRERTVSSDKKVSPFKQGNWIVFLPGIFLITVIGLLMVFVLNHSIVMFHGIVILIALIIILFIIHQYLVIADNIKLTREMKLINAQLESKVEQRTAELSKANVELQAEMTERKMAEDHLAVINEELLQVNREKDKLFSIMAHDLRSPLGSMMKLSELLVESGKDFDADELAEVAVTLHKSASQTFQLLNDLLAWSAVQMGRGERKKEQFRLSEVITENVSLLTPEASRKNIDFRLETDDHLEVFADKFAILTVVRNLLNNAVKFTSSGGTVVVKSGMDDKMVRISIIDNGIGISDERQKSIFKIDALSSSPGTDGEKGTGFGLVLCKDLIVRNGGEIWLESKKGRGSAFHFTLPVIAAPEELLPPPKDNIPGSMEYISDNARKLSFNTIKGVFTPTLFQSEIKRVWSRPDYNPEYSVLIDVRQASFVFEQKDFDSLIKIFSSMPVNNKSKKFALLTSTPQHVVYSTIFGQKIKMIYPLTVEIFSTYDAAISWLGG